MTPKGERRRDALVTAAAELLTEGGFDAVAHRSVARRAGLPLASTTYYFSSLDELLVCAVERIDVEEAARLRAHVTGLPRRRRSVDTTAELLADLIVGPVSEVGLTPHLISRYERRIACTRLAGVRESMRRRLGQRAELVAESFEKSGRATRIELVRTLICAVEGNVVSALVDGRDPRNAALNTGLALIDVLAPATWAAIPA